MDRVYKLRYLPLFYEDLAEKTLYIAQHLQNPQAASDLLDTVEAAILARRSNPEAFGRHFSIKERKYPYYRIYVKNFVVYYVLIDEGEDKIMDFAQADEPARCFSSSARSWQIEPKASSSWKTVKSSA